MQDDVSQPLSVRLAVALPYLRRHARALSGDQSLGDEYALGALQIVLDDPSTVLSASSLKVGLFRAFFQVWNRGSFGMVAEDGLVAQAQLYLQELTPHSRQALLLHAIEELSFRQIAEIMDKTLPEVENLISTARREMKKSIRGRVMVIEDESMIAMDLQDIVESMGHEVTGAAATHGQAVALAADHKPDLILSDIQLADGTSGIDAVDDILRAARGIPVIFITAFPERLLTGERREPAFVITKPYAEEQVQSAISQAMFFRSTAELHN
ncbi:response regulator [Yoonia sp. R2-816]|uniref:response regulator n=1 Tax=Yoonia sp. R2-816 TaxID=3342638 RepID=UPI00372A9DF2